MTLRVLFFGMGSIGQRHARLLVDHFRAELFAFRTRRGQNPVRGLPVREITSPSDLARLRPDAVFITNPTHLHGPTAMASIRRGARRIFLEKPVESDLRRLGNLRRAQRKSRVTIYVAYPLRFQPLIVSMRGRLATAEVHHVRMVCSSWLPDWRPGQDYRQSYSAHADQGGGVLLDLSHEFDLLQHLTRLRILRMEGIAGRSGRLQVRSEDYADVLVELEGGGRANVHLDFCSRRRERQVQIDYDGGSMEGDLINGLLREEGRNRPLRRKFAGDPDDMYLKQLRYFFDTPDADLRRDFEEKADLTEKILRFRAEALR